MAFSADGCGAAEVSGPVTIIRRTTMDPEAVKKDILGFMYAERMKSALLVAGQLLDVLGSLDEAERSGAFKILGSFVKAVGTEMRLAAHVMGASDWHGLDAELNLMEGHARLRETEAARQQLSRTLSRVTTLSGRLMSSLKDAGLL
ncbi:MAG: hypothetical protein ACLFVT_08495 [Syntrophobacteria bacterium]